MYISEIAPARLRGVLNVSFQLMITIGILCGYLVVSATRRINTSWAWRVGIAAAVIPSSIVTLGSLFLPDTPNSLINRDSHEEAQSLLRRIRGTEDISDEYSHLVAASEQCKVTKHPWWNILKRKYRGPLVMSILIAIFQQFAGIKAMVFYAPVIFRTLAVGGDSTRMVDMILRVFNVAATLVCFLDVDRLGRRKVFLQGGSQMIFCQVMVGAMLGIKYRSGEALDSFSQTYAGFVLLFICLFVSAYAYSWGPLGWLVPSEIFPLEVRPAGQSIAVSVNMLCTLTVNQAFPAMLCRIKYALFFFFAGWVLVMTAVVMIFLPETKNVPIEEMMLVWKDHWFWGRFIADEEVRVAGRGSTEAELTFIC